MALKPLRAASSLRSLRKFGPYAAAVLLLPGGSLLPLVRWLYRRANRRT